MKLKNLALHFSGHCSVIGCFSVVVNVNQKMRCDKKKSILVSTYSFLVHATVAFMLSDP